MTSPRFRILEPAFYLLALTLAVGLRFAQLGALPLSDAEASWALQALDVSRGLRPVLGPQPGYILLTSILFFLMESTNFLARFWPALTGSLMVFAPLAFRQRIGRIPALVLAFGLALDPGLVGLSRQSGSLILALGAAALAWAAWEWRKPALAGVFAGLALLGGPSLWMGLLTFGLAFVLAEGALPTLETEAGPASTPRPVKDELKVAGMFGIGALLLVGTLFLFSPNGLSAALASIPAFMRGWLDPSNVPVSRVLLGLVVYQPLPLLFALAAIVRAVVWRGMLSRLPEDAPPGLEETMRTHIRLSFWLAIWAGVTLLLVLVYPSRQVADLGWLALPLWALAALEIAHHLDAPRWEASETFGALALTVAILGFAWLDFMTLNGVAFQTTDWTNRLILAFGALAMLALCLIMIALGWSLGGARRGGVWGLLLILGLYTFGAAWGAGGLRTADGMELWQGESQAGQVTLLAASVDDISEWSKGIASDLTVQIVGVDSPALEWALRRHPIEKASALDPLSSPDILVTQPMTDLSLPAAYRGQDFTLRRSPLWSQLPAFDWVRWLTLRTFPQQTDQVILWVRNDLFIDANSQP